MTKMVSGAREGSGQDDDPGSFPLIIPNGFNQSLRFGFVSVTNLGTGLSAVL